MTKPNSTHIHILIDRSGSMAPVANDVAGWYATFLAAQKSGPGECSISLATFDDGSYDVVVPPTDVQKAPPTFVLHARGFTPLLDSVARSINEVGIRLSALPEEERPSKVILIVQTDGLENASREYDLAKVKALVERQRTVYNWEFMFLGADIDAYGVGSSIGVAAVATGSIGNNAQGYRVAASVMSAAVLRSRSGETLAYTAGESAAMTATVTPSAGSVTGTTIPTP